MPVFRDLIKLCFVVSVFMISGSATAQDGREIPFLAEETHLGVASCVGSSCHGALEPWSNSTVKQNEYIVWIGHCQTNWPGAEEAIIEDSQGAS